MLLIDTAAKMYAKSISGNPNKMFPKKERVSLAQEYIREFEMDFRQKNGNLF
jgi:hypothetical protein